VTNLDLPLDQIWNIYNSRADCENRIRELKQDFELDAFCLQDFWATEASFLFIMAAYNLLLGNGTHVISNSTISAKSAEGGKG